MKIGIIGFGAIGFDVAKKLDKEKYQFNVIGVHSRTKNKIIEKTKSFNSPLNYLELDEICKICDLVIDCAPKEAFKEIVFFRINKLLHNRLRKMIDIFNHFCGFTMLIC